MLRKLDGEMAFVKSLFRGTGNSRIRVIGLLVCSLLLVAQMFFLLGALEQPAHAYVDPGSGLLLFQVISTSLAGTAFLLWNRLRRFFRKELPAPEGEDKGPKAEDGRTP
jgi:hypothetical protein